MGYLQELIGESQKRTEALKEAEKIEGILNKVDEGRYFMMDASVPRNEYFKGDEIRIQEDICKVILYLLSMRHNAEWNSNNPKYPERETLVLTDKLLPIIRDSGVDKYSAIKELITRLHQGKIGWKT